MKCLEKRKITHAYLEHKRGRGKCSFKEIKKS